MNSNQFNEKFNAITDAWNYWLSPIYDELVNEWYFDYSSFAEGIFSLLRNNKIAVISELCIGSWNAMKEMMYQFGDTILYQGIDIDIDMLNKCRLNLWEKWLDLIQWDISKTSLPQKSDIIFFHSADPMIFWQDQWDISLALNSKSQFKKILLNVFHNLNDDGVCIVNIEQRWKEFPGRFHVEILKEQSETINRIIYIITDLKDKKEYSLALEKAPELDIERVSEIIQEVGFIDFQIDKSNKFIVFKK